MSFRDINIDVCKALGLDPDDVTQIVIEFTAGYPPKVEIVRHTLDDAGELVRVIRNCELTPKSTES